jgi:hypothetical protein
MTDEPDNEALFRKVVLWGGLLVSALLFLFPHRLLTVYADGGNTYSEDIGRGFILSSALPTAVCVQDGPLTEDFAPINYVRQITEVAIALAVTFGWLLALRLKQPAGDWKHDAEE